MAETFVNRVNIWSLNEQSILFNKQYESKKNGHGWFKYWVKEFKEEETRKTSSSSLKCQGLPLK